MAPQDDQNQAALRSAALFGKSPLSAPNTAAGLAEALIRYVPPGAFGLAPSLDATNDSAAGLAEALLSYPNPDVLGSSAPASDPLADFADGDGQPGQTTGSNTLGDSIEPKASPSWIEGDVPGPSSSAWDPAPLLSAELAPGASASPDSNSSLAQLPSSLGDPGGQSELTAATQDNLSDGQSVPTPVQLSAKSGGPTTTSSAVAPPPGPTNSLASTGDAFVQSPFIGPDGERYFEKVVARDGGRQTILRVDDHGRLVGTYSVDLGAANDAPSPFDFLGPGELKTGAELFALPLAKFGLKAGLAAIKGLAPKVAAIPFGPAEREAARLAAEEAAARAPDSLEAGAELKPYRRSSGGHHPVAQSALRGEPAYDEKTALAVSNNELARWNVDHDSVSVAQHGLYSALAKEGRPMTWDDVQSIETQALIHGGMPPDVAYATVRGSVDALKSIGISAPKRIPWSKVNAHD